jgi:hypothetical protein
MIRIELQNTSIEPFRLLKLTRLVPRKTLGKQRVDRPRPALTVVHKPS